MASPYRSIPLDRRPVCNGDGTFRVKLTRGLFCTIDECDVEQVARCAWWSYTGRKHHTWYAYGRPDGRSVQLTPVYMHVFLIQPDEGLFVDHIDGNGLNNRRSNLRIVTHTENMRNVKHRGAESRLSKFSLASK